MKVKKTSKYGNFEDQIVEMSEKEIIELLKSGDVFVVSGGYSDCDLVISVTDSYEGE